MAAQVCDAMEGAVLGLQEGAMGAAEVLRWILYQKRQRIFWAKDPQEETLFTFVYHGSKNPQPCSSVIICLHLSTMVVAIF